jgi:RES domain-containing protein
MWMRCAAVSKMVEELPVTREALPRTVRLVSSARLRDPVLLALAAEEDLAALAEIEGATSGRLVAEARGFGDVSPHELVHGVPHKAHINAAFAYARPQALNRFNGPDRGAWYAALDIETCLAEVAFHLARFLADTGIFEAVVDYAELFASFAGEFLDLRAAPGHPALDPDPALGYPAGNRLANAALDDGLNGILYPSVRHAGGICIAALVPHAVQSVAQGDMWRLTWAGSPVPVMARIS